MLIEKTKRYKTKVKRTRVAGRFKKKTQAIQELVERDLGDRGPPKRADGTISLDGDWLSENAPSDHDSLQCLIQHDKLQKILTTYLDLYAQTDAVYPRINTLGPRSGRRSASGPNIQNIPKRKWGIRGLFVPRPDHYFVRCDYTAQELFTLCQAMIDLGIERGPLWEGCVNSVDNDLHCLNARLMKQNEKRVKWDEKLSAQLLGCLLNDPSTSAAAGIGLAAFVENTASFPSVKRTSPFIGPPFEFGSEQFPPISRCAIPVTILGALIQNISGWEPEVKTHVTRLIKDAEGPHVAVQDLITINGRADDIQTQNLVESIVDSILDSAGGVRKRDRQGAKVVAFGVPGGLGAKSLRDYAYTTFGVRWTLKEAKQARAAFLKAFPDIVAFLDKLRPGVDILQEQTGMSEFDWKMWLDANDIYAWNPVKALCEHPDPATRLIGEAAARAVPITMTSGRIRGGAKFTEAANSHFQGRGADVTKHAEWLCFKKFGRPPTIVCHDEIVMEFPLLESGDTEAHDKLIKKDSLERLMKQAFIDMCPDVGPYARVEGKILAKWGKSTDKDGKEIE